MPIIANLYKRIKGVKTIVYPITKEECVRDTDGNRLSDKLQKMKESISNATPNISIETTGSGNAVTDASVSDGKVTLTKGATFLTEHPAVETTDSTLKTTLYSTSTFSAVDSLTLDDTGHIIKILRRTFTLPKIPSLSTSQNITTSGSYALDASQANFNVSGTFASKIAEMISLELYSHTSSEGTVSLTGLANGIHLFETAVTVTSWISTKISGAIIISVKGTNSVGSQIAVTSAGIYYRNLAPVSTQENWKLISGTSCDYGS